jgi:glycosyltransferase involved in cell wall biosynthesis
VLEHIRDGETAIIVDGRPESYVRGIRKVMDPANKSEIDRMCQHARKVVLEQFNFEHHAQRQLDIMNEAVREST